MSANCDVSESRDIALSFNDVIGSRHEWWALFVVVTGYLDRAEIPSPRNFQVSFTNPIVQ